MPHKRRQLNAGRDCLLRLYGNMLPLYGLVERQTAENENDNDGHDKNGKHLGDAGVTLPRILL